MRDRLLRWVTRASQVIVEFFWPLLVVAVLTLIAVLLIRECSQ